jgi:hypothetical protein
MPLSPREPSSVHTLARTGAVALLLLVAACGNISKGGDPQESRWNMLWPTPPEAAYWGTWKSANDGSWLGIDSAGEGYFYRDGGKENGWVKIPLRVVKPRWGSGWDLVTEAGARYRMPAAGPENRIAVTGPGEDGRFERAALPDEVAAAPLYPRTEGAPAATFSTDDDGASWWPF